MAHFKKLLVSKLLLLLFCFFHHAMARTNSALVTITAPKEQHAEGKQYCFRVHQIFKFQVMHSNLMWFWSVSLADQLLGQFFIFLVWPKENCRISETGQFILFTLLNISSLLFSKIGHSLIFRPDKKNQESGQKEIVRSLRLVKFFWPTKKMRN